MQVAMHNTPDDVWVSFLGGVYNITDLVAVSSLQNGGHLMGPWR